MKALLLVADNVGSPKGIGIPDVEGAGLPKRHLKLLTEANGLTLYHGAFRLFGLESAHVPSLRQWNAPSTWRFAWDERIDPFFVIGETVWGDQYAYHRDAAGQLEPEIYLLEGNFLRPHQISSSFDDFLTDEVLRNATQPYDEFTIEAVAHLGDATPSEHWVLSPSLAIGGPESIENIVRLPSATAMTIAGDIASALAASKAGSFPTRVEPWTDQHGRSRLRVEFS